MDQKKIEYLHKAYLEGSLDPVEMAEWDALLKSDLAEQPVKLFMEETWHSILPEERMMLSSEESGRLYDRIISQARKKSVRLWPKIAVAAAVASITLGVWFYTSDSGFLKGERDGMASASDIAPGKNRATLTLANGQTVALSDGKTGVVVDHGLVRYSSGTLSSGSLKGGTDTAGRDVVHALAGVEMLRVETPRGGTYQVVLADGTHVWLNAASSLKFPSKFMGAERRVQITGEAYFEVASASLPGRMKKQPFIVESAGQEVTVLGTHFNINGYSDEPAVKTTLMEGSVRVKSGTNVRTIRPGEQAVNNGAELKVLKVNTALVTDWKEEAFNLEGADFRVAMREIARWYDIEVVYDKSVPQDIEAWGWISRKSRLSSVLNLIENSGQVKFRFEGKKLYVYK
ncbi:FecR family protein [Pedobacter deserti]|uniref:FecR family protein n=1 Tax=Pedobacter deserti TaxID=2817382 RepID=UPI00210B97FB|nr:FecR family protein [Pedobacter sp. SYSU D00382]